MATISGFVVEPCPGCGYAYITAAATPTHPHNQAECVAYKRGYEAGREAAKRDAP